MDTILPTRKNCMCTCKHYTSLPLTLHFVIQAKANHHRFGWRWLKWCVTHTHAHAHANAHHVHIHLHANAHHMLTKLMQHALWEHTMMYWQFTLFNRNCFCNERLQDSGCRNVFIWGCKPKSYIEHCRIHSKAKGERARERERGEEREESRGNLVI